MTQAQVETGSAAAVVLAGGKSSRLGRDKASEVILGRSLLQIVLDRFMGLVSEYVVVRARGQKLPPLGSPRPVTVVADLYPESGPLGGIYTGLEAMRSPFAVVVACDMPLLEPALLAELIRLAPFHDLVVPVGEKGLPEPLCAAYSKACLGPIRNRLEAGAYKVTGFYDQLTPRYLSPVYWRRFDPQGRSFQNLNDEADLRRIEQLLREEAGRTE